MLLRTCPKPSSHHLLCLAVLHSIEQKSGLAYIRHQHTARPCFLSHFTGGPPVSSSATLKIASTRILDACGTRRQLINNRIKIRNVVYRAAEVSITIAGLLARNLASFQLKPSASQDIPSRRHRSLNVFTKPRHETFPWNTQTTWDPDVVQSTSGNSPSLVHPYRSLGGDAARMAAKLLSESLCLRNHPSTK